MSLSRLLLAWAVVAAWLALWEAVARPLARNGDTRGLRSPLWHQLGEAALLTSFGALWFASLGAGTWWLVFGLVGAWGEWRVPRETRRVRRRPLRELAVRTLGVLRVLVAGGLLAWRLAPA